MYLWSVAAVAAVQMAAVAVVAVQQYLAALLQ
jgi:hypothetical protein